VQRFQPGADDIIAELLHQGRWPGWVDAETNRKPLKKQLARPPADHRCGRCISSLTVPQGFVFSARDPPWDGGCADFLGGAANGGRARFPSSSFGLSRPGPVPLRWNLIWPCA